MSDDSNRSKYNNIKMLFRDIVVIVLLSALIQFFFVSTFNVPTESMKETILPGDKLLGTKYDYGYSKYSAVFFTPNFIKGRFFAKQPQRGDIIVFKPPNNPQIKRYIKRLIGLPGDTIQFINNRIFINEHPVIREYDGIFEDSDGKYKKYIETLPNGVMYKTLHLINPSTNVLINRFANTEVFHVPKDHYFFVGDNRDESGDSRVNMGYVPFENLIAKARFIFFSSDKEIFSDGLLEWFNSIKSDRFFKTL